MLLSPFLGHSLIPRVSVPLAPVELPVGVARERDDVVEDNVRVRARAEHELVVEVVVPHAPHPVLSREKQRRCVNNAPSHTGHVQRGVSAHIRTLKTDNAVSRYALRRDARKKAIERSDRRAAAKEGRALAEYNTPVRMGIEGQKRLCAVPGVPKLDEVVITTFNRQGFDWIGFSTRQVYTEKKASPCTVSQKLRFLPGRTVSQKTSHFSAQFAEADAFCRKVSRNLCQHRNEKKNTYRSQGSTACWG